jgi:hypothetical protein
MNNWVLNTSYVEENINAISEGSNFIYETRLDYVPFAEKDPYVILHNQVIDDMHSAAKKRAWHNDEFDSYHFNNLGIIREIKTPEILPFSEEDKKENEKRKKEGKPLLKPKKWYNLSLQQEYNLIANNIFQDLAYSMLAVYNYGKPIGHFQGQIRSLRNADYTTIKKGRIYIARTAFGKIVNAIPYENKFEFSVFISRKYKTSSFRNLDYIKILKDLINYIENRIHNKGKLLVATDKMIDSLSKKTNLVNASIGFYDDEVNAGNNIKKQADFFEELFNHIEETNLLSSIKANVKQEPNRDFFNELFQNRKWPIYMN